VLEDAFTNRVHVWHERNKEVWETGVGIDNDDDNDEENDDENPEDIEV